MWRGRRHLNLIEIPDRLEEGPSRGYARYQDLEVEFGRAALVVAAVRVPRGNVDHLAGFTLMLTVSEPDRRAAFKNYKEQVNIVGMQRRVPAVAKKAGEHGRALRAGHHFNLVARVAGIDGVGS